MKLIQSILVFCLAIGNSYGQLQNEADNGMIDLHFDFVDAKTGMKLALSELVLSIDSIEVLQRTADGNGNLHLYFCPEKVKNKVIQIEAYGYQRCYFTTYLSFEILSDSSFTIRLTDNLAIGSIIKDHEEFTASLVADVIEKKEIYPYPDVYYEHCDGRVLAGRFIEKEELKMGVWRDISDENYLIPIYQTIEPEGGDPVCLINPASDTIVPYTEEYFQIYGGVIKNWGAVLIKRGERLICIGIDNLGRELFEIYWFDNGPDYIKDGRFRIVKDGKIGFADKDGNIIVEPQFECADFFRDGMAKVTYTCELIPSGEYKAMESDSWFYIDLNGNKIEGK